MHRFSLGIAAALASALLLGQSNPPALAPGSYQIQCGGVYQLYPVAAPSAAPSAVPSAAPTAVAYFSTLPIKAALPSESYCAGQVNSRPIAEAVPVNAAFNSTAVIPTAAQLASFHSNPQPFKGDTQGIPQDYQYADGNFSGSTDMLIRNAACKWGIDEDTIRAEAQNESGGWLQKGAGDKRTSQSQCAQSAYPALKIWNTTVVQPGGFSVNCPNCCYQSWGITQNKLFYEPTAFPYAVNSTAFTLDLTYAKIRSCINGNYSTYFASASQQPNTYAADLSSGNLTKMLWGCIGSHFSGGWYDSGANQYIAQVQSHLQNRDWP